MTDNHAQNRPAWQTDELEDEWIDQDEPSESAFNPVHSNSDISLTQAIGSLLITKEHDRSSSVSSANTVGTVLVREDVPAAPILPKTPGGNRKNLVKDFFSPLPLERMFEPPSPPQAKPSNVPASAPIIPSRLSQVHLPEPDSTQEVSEIDPGSAEETDGRVNVSRECDQLNSGNEDRGPNYQFTFAAPRPSPFDPMAQSTPGPSHYATRSLHAPPTDPRLRLFQFNYDTFTRDHLSAMVDSIAVNTPSGGSVGTPQTELNGSSSGDISEHSISRLRSAKRIKLSPASDYSPVGDGTALIMRPQTGRKDYVGESKSLMEKIRQNRDFSTISTTTSAQSPTSRKIGSSHDSLPHSPNNFLAVPEPDHSSDRTTSSKRSIYSSLAYREQAANLMAQIRNDVKGSKRLFSAETELSHVERSEHNAGMVAAEGAADDHSYSGDTEIIDDEANENGNNLNVSVASSTASYTRPIVSPRKVLRKISAQQNAESELSLRMSQVSLNSDGLLDQFPDPPIQVLVTSASSIPSSPVAHTNHESQANGTHLAPPAITPPVYPTSSLRRNDDLTRFVSSSTASGTTITAGSAASFVKHAGPKQITHIAPSDVPALPDRVGKMVYDRITMKWVKVTSQAISDEQGGTPEGSNDSEDPFRDIESLREDSSEGKPGSGDEEDHSVLTAELEKSRVEDVPSDAEGIDEEEAELTSFSFDGLSVEVAPTNGSAHYGDLEESDSDDDHDLLDDREEDTATSQQSDSLLLNSYSSEAADDTPPNRLAPTSSPALLSTPVPVSRSNASVPTPIIRSAMKSSSVTPLSAMKQTPINCVSRRRSVSFSDGRRDGPIEGIGRNAPSSEAVSGSDSELEDELDATEPSTRSLLPSARSKRIADMLEGLDDDAFVDDSPSKNSSGRPPTDELQPIKPRKPSSTRAVVGSPSRDLSRRVFSKTESFRSSRAPSRNATFLTECSFGVAHDRLVQVITDVQPFEPHWEQLSSIDLSKKNLDSVVRLKELLPRLDSLFLNSNQLLWLSGVPGGVRTLSVAFNCLTGVTSFSHLLNLESLDISDNGIDSLRQLECLRHLRELRADGNNVDNIDGLQKMDGLVKLSLQRNNIRTIDLTACRWTRLEMLNLSQNRLSTIHGLSSLPALVALNLDNNLLGELDPNGSMPRLRILRVSGNRLQQLNASPFPNLRTLYADNNSLGPIIKAYRLTKLENLSLRNQGGRGGLTLCVSDVRDVKRLYLSGNPLKSGFISEPCYNLIYLELAACRLTVLPQDFSRMAPNLRVLNLNYNFLEETWPLDGLTRLRKLTIIGSRINASKHLIRVLRGKQDIEMLDFRMNPCTLGWYLPLLVKDVPGALQPSDGDRRKPGPSTGLYPHLGASPKLDDGSGAQALAGRNGMKSRGANSKPDALDIAGSQLHSPSSSKHLARAAATQSTSTAYGQLAKPSLNHVQSTAWKDLDSKFRRDLPDDAYVGRMVYRGLVMRSCPGIRMLDGIEVSDKEKDKAERILKEVMGATSRDPGAKDSKVKGGGEQEKASVLALDSEGR
ncbi:unnamed protein product [Somion occarium]|uniref:Septation initiation network scaffold protein cdc11 n=1 Tax=Somion occarium TaxID=3059160 RepID=A0ABP1E2G6_9APHY